MGRLIWLAALALVATMQCAHAAERSSQNTYCGPDRAAKPEAVSDLIRRTSVIVLGRVTGARPEEHGSWKGRNTVFTISIAQVVKGPDVVGTLTVHGLADDSAISCRSVQS
jgi:hypothetical protein